MTTIIVEIDKAGRIVVPKKLRDALHLTPGSRLSVARSGNTLIFEPDVARGRLIIENGVPLILPSEGETFPVLEADYFTKLLDRIRTERDQYNEGLSDDETEA